MTILATRPVPSSAQVIKPTKLKTAIVGTMITIEAVLDKPGLRITEGQCKVNDEDVSSAFDLGRDFIRSSTQFATVTLIDHLESFLLCVHSKIRLETMPRLDQ